MKKILLTLTLFVVMFSSVYSDTITLDWSVYNNTNDLSFATTDVGIVNENNELVVYYGVDQEILFGDEENNDAVTPFSFENNLEGYTGDLNTLTEFTACGEIHVTPDVNDDYGNLIWGLHPGQFYNGNWTGMESQLYESLNQNKYFLYNDFTGYTEQIALTTPYDNEVRYCNYVNTNTDTLIMSFYEMNNDNTTSKTFSYSTFYGAYDYSLTDMFFYGYTNQLGDEVVFSNFTLSSPEIVLSVEQPPQTTLGNTGIGEFTEDVMTGTGNGVVAVAPAIAVFLITVSVISLVGLFFRWGLKR